MINLSTLVEDLKTLTNEEVTKVQLAVNGEWSARVQDERLARRIDRSLVAAQSAGMTDEEIEAKIEEGKKKARAPRDPGDLTTPGRSNPQADLRKKNEEFLGTIINK